eukprot:9407933-Pyramimonas_sp.AAC.1
MTDMIGIGSYLRRAPKRRSCPPWSLPGELWGIVTDPEFGLAPDRLGLGADKELDSAVLYTALHKGLQCVRFAGRFPRLWNRSFGRGPPKSSVPGPEGKR